MRLLKENTKTPRISLVGAGPGDRDLITVKGLKAIQSADVILYDALSTPDLLLEAPLVPKIFVGKRAGIKCKSQDDINLLLVQSAYEYGHAVRLKGGDPYIFGRGHEEKLYAEGFDIRVDVIPGISSATSLPLLHEVPLTRRDVSESFWVLTGSTKNHQLSNDIKLAAKSTATLVILMAMRKLELIVDILKGEGKENIPIMLVQSGSTVNEKVVVSTIKEVVEAAATAQIGTPGIMIIGEVVGLSPLSVYNQIATQKLIN